VTGVVTYILSEHDRVTYLLGRGGVGKGKRYLLTSEKIRYICDEMT